MEHDKLPPSTTRTRAANSLRQAVQQWDAMQARHEPPNANDQPPCGSAPTES